MACNLLPQCYSWDARNWTISCLIFFFTSSHKMGNNASNNSYVTVAVTISPVFTLWLLWMNTKLSPGSNLNSNFPPTTRNWIKSPLPLWSAAKRRSPSLAFVWNVISMVFNSELNEMLLCSKKEFLLKAGKWRSTSTKQQTTLIMN